MFRVFPQLYLDVNKTRPVPKIGKGGKEGSDEAIACSGFYEGGITWPLLLSAIL